MKNKILDDDFLAIINSSCPIKQLQNSSILISGATGLIGSSLIHTFYRANSLLQTNINVIALARNKDKATSMFKAYIDSGYVTLITGDICSPIITDKHIDYIIHCASPTSSKYFVSNPVETILTAIKGTENILEFAKSSHIKSMVYLSSLEVYGTPISSKSFVNEYDYGYLDPTNIRSSYSEGKRLIECLCSSYSSEYNVPVKIARLSQTFGPGVDYNDGRVFAEFARCVIEKKDIILHTPGKTVRTYCYTADAISAIITILTNGISGEAYNVSNMNTGISIIDMAKLVCDTFPSSNIHVKIDIPEDLNSYGYNPEMIIRLDTTKLNELGWSAQFNLRDMFIRLVNCMTP